MEKRKPIEEKYECSCAIDYKNCKEYKGTQEVNYELKSRSAPLYCIQCTRKFVDQRMRTVKCNCKYPFHANKAKTCHECFHQPCKKCGQPLQFVYTCLKTKSKIEVIQEEKEQGEKEDKLDENNRNLLSKTRKQVKKDD